MDTAHSMAIPEIAAAISRLHSTLRKHNIMPGKVTIELADHQSVGVLLSQAVPSVQHFGKFLREGDRSGPWICSIRDADIFSPRPR